MSLRHTGHLQEGSRFLEQWVGVGKSIVEAGVFSDKSVISYQLSQRGRSVQSSPVGSGRNVGP